jgi:hypothetical protein
VGDLGQDALFISGLSLGGGQLVGYEFGFGFWEMLKVTAGMPGIRHSPIDGTSICS